MIRQDTGKDQTITIQQETSKNPKLMIRQDAGKDPAMYVLIQLAKFNSDDDVVIKSIPGTDDLSISLEYVVYKEFVKQSYGEFCTRTILEFRTNIHIGFQLD
ncbi:hypothetical protein CEXT_329971 [Caerostris extrusa]|uniref:Uncharacterized protein n=1 Tax=Caerostris extrusa TaxID=172846 RepID=A0AAV4XFX4_CAEEX|nr:hypothetical protein CEXT_329971 [Caerostris extrusa]